MFRTQCVLAFLSLYAGLVHSFSWEIVISNDNRLEFYDINGTQTYTQNVTSTPDYIRTIFYDSVHNRVLFAMRKDILSFEIASKTIESLVTTSHYVTKLAYDPVADVLFWTEVNKRLYSISLKPGFNNKTEERHLVVSEDKVCDIGVDSYGGFIYWTVNYYGRGVRNLQRAKFNGSEKEVVIDHISGIRFKIDQQTQKIYWFDVTMDANFMYTCYIKCSDLNGKNVRTIHTYPEHSDGRLTISKDFIYLKIRDSFWKIPKNPSNDIDVQPVFLMEHHAGAFWQIATNYNNEDQIRGIQNCEALSNLPPNNTVTNVSSDVSLLCVHGTKVNGESRCECTQGYSGERCDVSLCYNYCLHGDCSASTEGQPRCRCYVGYSGERCEVFPCQGYCLNSGVCSLNENHGPVCQCSEDYGGERCDVPDLRF